MSRRLLLLSLLALAAPADPAEAVPPPPGGDGRPNILWITCEDINPQLGCFGDAYAETPHLDRFAAGALRYPHCWSTAPVCAPARTAIITGVYPTSTGAEHMRSLVPPPAALKMYPQLLREAGYYCTNNAKTDYNLEAPGRLWDDCSKQAHWKNRPAGRPFLSVFNIEASHESQIRTRPHILRHDPAKAPIPAYHPDTPEVRHDWAQYYDQITVMDGLFAERLRELEEAGLADETLVLFCGDNGGGMPRSKRCACNSGLNVPLIVRVPEKFKALAPADYKPGAPSDRLVGFVDFAPTFVSLAGVEPPSWMQGLAFLGRYATPPPKYIHGFRGRMDERTDLVRSVRDQRYIYIRNYMPHLIYGQYIDYMFQTPTTRVWKQLYDEGTLKPPQTCFWEPKPPEELYDLQADPDEVKNLAGSPDHQAVLAELRQAQREHALRIRDVGFLSEAEFHRRSEGSTPYDLGHDPRQYPLEKILDMADAASMLKSEALPRLQEGLRDAESGVRYWAAMGLLMRGAPAVEASREGLRAALQDESPTVRVTAARALGQHGNASDLPPALAALKDLAPPDRNGAYVSMLALNAIEALGNRAESLKDALRTMPSKDPKAPGRANGYVDSLLQHMVGRGSAKPDEAAPAPAPRRKKQ
jgi:arylsulfatase A-like enzyme